MIQTEHLREGEPQEAPRRDSQTVMNQKGTQCDWQQSPWLRVHFPRKMKPQKHQTHLLFLDDLQKTTKGCDCAWKTQKIKQKKKLLKNPEACAERASLFHRLSGRNQPPTKCKDVRENLTGSHPFERGSEHEVNTWCFKQKTKKKETKASLYLKLQLLLTQTLDRHEKAEVDYRWRRRKGGRHAALFS